MTDKMNERRTERPLEFSAEGEDTLRLERFENADERFSRISMNDREAVIDLDAEQVSVLVAELYAHLVWMRERDDD